MDWYLGDFRKMLSDVVLAPRQTNHYSFALPGRMEFPPVNGEKLIRGKLGHHQESTRNHEGRGENLRIQIL